MTKAMVRRVLIRAREIVPTIGAVEGKDYGSSDEIVEEEPRLINQTRSKVVVPVRELIKKLRL
jgi:hypothetical protein